MNVLFLDRSLDGYDILSNACNETTICITYTRNTTREELYDLFKMHENVSRIAFAFHYSPQYIFLDNENIFNENNTNFLIDLFKNNNIQNVDFLACNTLQDSNWKTFYETIISETNVVLGASNNNTGNIQYGGDWIMETTSEDIQSIYFNDTITYYTYLLGQLSNFTNILSNDTIYNVGDNAYGQLGRGWADNGILNLVDLKFTEKPASQVVCSTNFTMILTTDGTIYGSGINTNGQLGIGSTSNVSVFQIIPNFTGKTPSQIACGDNHLMVLMTDGTIYGSGLNSNGQLGIGNNTQQTSLTLMTNSTGRTPSQISCGQFYTIVLMTDGTIYGTGFNGNGQLGTGNTTNVNTLSLMTNSTGKTPSQIACGANFTIVLMTDGTIYGTGSNINGQLGTGNTTQRNSLTSMTNSTGGTPSQISCGQNYTIVLMTDGTIYGTGFNGSGQLGTGNTTHKSTLTLMTNSTGKTPSQIACGVNTIVLMTDGTIYGTGFNGSGQLGRGNTTNVNTLSLMTNSTGKMPSQINCGGNNTAYACTILLMTDGTLYGCGSNLTGKLGLKSNNFTAVTNSTGKIPTQISYGSEFTIVLMTDGTIYGTGRNLRGELGIGSTTSVSSLTLMINSTEKTPSQIACGGSHFTIVLMSDGTIYGTGFNNYGQLGRGNTTNVNTLSLMTNSTGKTPSRIACGSNFTIVLMTDGTIYGTGENFSYQLGTGNTTQQTTLTLMPNSTGKIPSQIACGNSHLIVLMTDGTIYGIGDNAYGELGNGTDNTQQSSLTLMTNSTGKIPSQIDCGNYFTMVLMTDGTIYGTGFNESGQLGTGNTTNVNTLSLMTNSTGKIPSQIICGSDHVNILMTDGNVYGTGNNTYGQLGIENTIQQTSLTKSIIAATRSNPTLSNFSLSSKVVGDSPFIITAPTTNSTGSFSYESSNTAVATVSGSTITIVGVGSTTITATQAADSNYSSGTITTTLTVNKINPSLSNFVISEKTFGDEPFVITAPTTNSTGAFTYTSSNTSVATISGSTITIFGAGSTTITATQAEDSNYSSGVITATLTVNKINPSLSSFVISDKIFGDEPFVITAPSSTGTGSFDYSSSNTSVASISGSTITIFSVGSTTITATQSGDSNYNSGTISTTLTVNKANPSLTSFSFSEKTVGDEPFVITAPSSTSTGSFSYESNNPLVATISGNTITIVGSGSATITASQYSNDNYNSGIISATLNVKNPSPTFSNFLISQKVIGDDPFVITAPTSNSTGEITYESSNTSVATISGSTITIVGAGSTTITATQAADSNFSSGIITTTFSVRNPSPGLSNFSFDSKVFGASSFAITAPTSNSTGEITYESNNTSVATISGSTITIVGAGSTTITATQAADSNYNSDTISATLYVNKATPILGSFVISDKIFGGDPFYIEAPTSTSTGSFDYESSNTSVATISGNIITIVGAGSTTITATQGENANYFSTSISSTLSVNKAVTSLDNFTFSEKAFGNDPFDITAPTTNSTGSFSYESNNPLVATISGSTITIVGAGSAIITASQSENDNYLSKSISAVLTVNKINPFLDNFSFSEKVFGNGPFVIGEPTSNSTGSFSYESSNPLVATISETTITIVGAGSTIITASQASDNNYNSGTITATLTVNKLDTTISSTSPITKSYGDSPFSISFSSNNPENSSFSSSNTNVATINSEGLITIINVGTADITITQSGTANYNGNSKVVTLNIEKTYTASVLKGNGFTASQLKSAGYSASELKTALFTITELKNVSFSDTEIINAGYTVNELISNSYTIQQLREYSTSPASVLDYLIEQSLAMPNPPVIANVLSGNGYITIYFADVNNGSNNILGYKYTLNGGTTQFWAANNVSPVSIYGLTNGTSYNVGIYAINANGSSQISNIISDVIPSSVPEKPFINNVAINNGTLTFNYSIDSVNGSSVTEYHYSLDQVNYTQTEPSNNLITVNSLSNNQTYFVSLKVKNASGFSSPSNTVLISSNVLPDAPTINSVVAGDKSCVVNFTNGNFYNSTVLCYKYILSDDSSTYRASAINTIESPITIYGLTNFTSYRIRIKVVCVSGESEYSNESQLFTPFGLPSPLVITKIEPGIRSALVYIEDNNTSFSQVTGYRYTLNNGSMIEAGSMISPITINNLVDRLPYSINFYSYNQIGISTSSNGMSINSGAPTSPVINSITTTSSTITINYTQSQFTNGSAIIRMSYSLDGLSFIPFQAVRNPLVITGLASGVFYDVSIRSINLNGSSPTSNIISNVMLYAAPAKLVITSVNLFYESVTTCYAVVVINTPVTNGSPITSYKYAIGASTTYTTITSTTLPITITGLPVNTNITLKLIAVNSYGESPVSSSSRATIFRLFVPNRPVVTSVITSMNTATVNFTKPAINGSEIITYKYSLNGGNYVDLNSAVIPFSVPIQNNVANNIQIIATNAVGDSLPSALLTRTFSFVYLTPLAPRITSIIGSNESLIVNFNPPTTRGAPVTGYSYSMDKGVTIVDSGTTVSPFTIPNLINNTSYTVTLYANSILGLSSGSNAVTAKPILAAPGIPVIASGTPKNNSCILTLQTAVINGSPITTYLYSINGSTTFTDSNQNASPITINGLANGTTYIFRLIAVNAIGNSLVSLPVTITPIYEIPSAPVITRITPGTGRLTVTFTASNPNGGTLSGYYYSFDDGVTRINIAHLGNALTINNLSRNQSYTVTLFSENELGFSQSSNSMTATTR